MISLKGPTAFQWSYQEQEYPLEKGLNGETLYAKAVNFGQISGTSRTVAHNIPNFSTSKLYSMKVMSTGQPLPWFDAGTWNNSCDFRIDSTNLAYYQGPNNVHNGQSVTVYLIYRK